MHYWLAWAEIDNIDHSNPLRQRKKTAYTHYISICIRLNRARSVTVKLMLDECHRIPLLISQYCCLTSPSHCLSQCWSRFVFDTHYVRTDSSSFVTWDRPRNKAILLYTLMLCYQPLKRYFLIILHNCSAFKCLVAYLRLRSSQYSTLKFCEHYQFWHKTRLTKWKLMQVTQYLHNRHHTTCLKIAAVVTGYRLLI